MCRCICRPRKRMPARTAENGLDVGEIFVRQFAKTNLVVQFSFHFKIERIRCGSLVCKYSYRIPVTSFFAMNAGCTSYSNCLR